MSLDVFINSLTLQTERKGRMRQSGLIFDERLLGNSDDVTAIISRETTGGCANGSSITNDSFLTQQKGISGSQAWC